MKKYGLVQKPPTRWGTRRVYYRPYAPQVAWLFSGLDLRW